MKINQVWIKNDLLKEDLDYDYDVVKKDKTIELMYSKSSEWTESVSGKICATLEDNGNRIKIKIGGNEIKLDYNELRELKCLLLAENDEHIEIRETNTIKMFK